MLDFIPIINANNKDSEINLVIYIGDLYKIVVGDRNNINFYIEKDGFFVPELKMHSEKNLFPNPISFDKWVALEIHQSVSSYSMTRTVTVNFYYIPDAFGIKDPERKTAGPYNFEINDDSPYDKVSREIRIGLVNSEKKNTIITEFKCFKLESY